VKIQEVGIPNRGMVRLRADALVSEPEMGDFRSQWRKLRTGFVDKLRRTLEDADKLVAAVMQ
jgi:hypothetical protein